MSIRVAGPDAPVSSVCVRYTQLQRRAKSTDAAASADRRSESRTGARHCGCCVLRRAKSAGAALPLPMQAVRAARRSAPRATPRPPRAAPCQERRRAWPTRAGLTISGPSSSPKSAAVVVALAAAASSRMRSLSSAQPSFLCHTDNHCADFEASAPLSVPIAVERDGLGLETKEACDQAHRAASQWRAASGRVRRGRPQSVPSVAWCFPGWNRHWRYRLRPNA